MRPRSVEMPYLVTVAGSRITLRRGQSYSIGRGMDCDVVVEDAAASRRHALLSVARTNDAVFLEDCGSRNGTFVNGEPVSSRIALREGARIQVGGSIFLVRLREREEERELSDTGTVAFDRGTFVQDLDGGELARYGLVELLKLVFNAQRNVTVHIALATEHARIEVRGGEVLSAECGGLQGFNALVKLGRQSSGIFWLVETEQHPDRNINEPFVRLLSELQRCLAPSGAQGTPPGR
jgi:pSer/pThr/pTyr-binding forkhead associated (FHA) protein